MYITDVNHLEILSATADAAQASGFMIDSYPIPVT
jgi:hypothetical protein